MPTPKPTPEVVSTAILPWLRHLPAIFLLWTIAFLAPNDSSFGDNRLNALSAQAILEHGSLDLSPYIESYGVDSIVGVDISTLTRREDSYYNTFPVGTALSMLPFVASAKFIFGADMVNHQDMITTRKFYSASVLSLLYLILYLICGLFLPKYLSSFLSVVTILGTTAVSTIALGAWSHNPAILCVAVLVYFMVSYSHKSKLPNPILFGAILFFAYLSRPSTIPWIGVAAIWALTIDWKFAVKAGLVTIAGLLLFVAVSFSLYGDLLPPYYMPGRVGGNPDFLEAVAANLVSPARGMFVFNPFLVLGLLSVFIPEVRKHYVYLALWLAYVASLLLISTFPHWWAGWSFGPRLQTESIPALLALSVISINALWPRMSFRLMRYGFLFLSSTFLGWGILVHTIQGAWSDRVLVWNGTIDQYHEDYVWQWEFPQFLAGFQPKEIASHYSIYKNELNQQLAEMPEGSSFYYTASGKNPRPYIRRLSRSFNRRNTFGERFIFNDWENAPVDGRKIYTNLKGKKALVAEGKKLLFEPMKSYRDIGSLLEEHLNHTNFVIANCVDPNKLSPFSRDILTSYCADWVKLKKRISLIMVVRDRNVMIEKASIGGTVEFTWRHEQFYVEMKAICNHCDTPPRIRFQGIKQGIQGYSAAFCSLNEETGGFEVQPIEINGADSEAPLLYMIKQP